MKEILNLHLALLLLLYKFMLADIVLLILLVILGIIAVVIRISEIE
jgi:hypothetical protein